MIGSRSCKSSHIADVIVTFKPIFHQNAKYLASGVGVGHCTRRQNFALPNAKYTNMLVSLALDDANLSRFYLTRNLKVAFYPTRNPNASQWNIGCVGCQRKVFASGMYISFFCVHFICVGQPTQTRFLVEYGLQLMICSHCYSYLYSHLIIAHQP